MSAMGKTLGRVRGSENMEANWFGSGDTVLEGGWGKKTFPVDDI